MKGHFYGGLSAGQSPGSRHFDYEEGREGREGRGLTSSSHPHSYQPGYSYSQADSTSTTSSANNRFTVHSYQFIEDYENISPRLIHSANIMHYENTLARTSLLGNNYLFVILCLPLYTTATSKHLKTSVALCNS